MEDALFDAMHEHSAEHWWFRARQRIVTHVLDRHIGRPSESRHRERTVSGTGATPGVSASPARQVLDLGCGVGQNLTALARYGQVYGADFSEKALGLCRQRFAGPLARIELPDSVPYEPESFDLIVMLDVLEHIADDSAALARVYTLLRPGATLCLTVPALRWLWSEHDVEHHHHRRYHRPELATRLTDAGFEIALLSYMNSLLLPLMATARVLLPHAATSVRDRGRPGPLDRLFYAAFASERHLLTRAPLPLGGSLIALAQRPAAA